MNSVFNSPLAGRTARFLISGITSTAVAYMVMMALLRLGLHYSLAVAGSWPPTVLVGFLLNRRFTFGIKGAERRYRHFGAFIVGSLLQLGVAIAGFGLLTQGLGLGPTPAFFVNLAITTTFSFAFMNLVTFRR